MPKCYAVKVGYTPGIYSEWKDAKEQVHGYRGALYRKFNDKSEAQNFLNAAKITTAKSMSRISTPASLVKKTSNGTTGIKKITGSEIAFSIANGLQLDIPIQAEISELPKITPHSRYFRYQHHRQQKISRFFILFPPFENFDVLYSSDNKVIQDWISDNTKQCFCTLCTSNSCAFPMGFDIEWKPSFRKGAENPAATLQLAVSASNHLNPSCKRQKNSSIVIPLVHLSKFPEELKTLMKNPKIFKVGVGCESDAKKLYNDTGIEVNGLVELAAFAIDCGQKDQVDRGRGLKALAKGFCKVNLVKPKRIRMGNWEKFPLSDEQIKYGGADAVIGLQIYESINQRFSRENDGKSAKPPTSNLIDIYYRGKKNSKSKVSAATSHQITNKKQKDPRLQKSKPKENPGKGKIKRPYFSQNIINPFHPGYHIPYHQHYFNTTPIHYPPQYFSPSHPSQFNSPIAEATYRNQPLNYELPIPYYGGPFCY